MTNNQTRLKIVLGEGSMKRLRDSTIAVVGLGGVGSVACEVLARSGVGTFVIVDRDIVDVTNINRQLVADYLTIGRKKTEVMHERIMRVHPDAVVHAYDMEFSSENDMFLFEHRIDFIVDAIDSIPAKIHLIKECLRRNIPFVSAMGAGNKLDPSKMKVTSIKKTTHDPIAKIIRKKLREEGLNADFPVVWSDESLKTQNKEMVGSYMAVTATSGLLAANEAIKQRTKQREIILAGGCFWGVEGYFKQLNGVIDTEVGYTDGSTEMPNYRDLCQGRIDHVEACRIIHDETVLSLRSILEHLFRFIDPTSLNKQGGDIGTQYRTGVYFIDEFDKAIIEAFISEEQKKYSRPIVVDVKPQTVFYPAEEYHQDYLDKNPSGYCHVDFGLIKPDERK